MGNDLIQAIGVGVISGVLSSALILVLAVLIKKVLVPWYRSLIYSGVNISGEWHCIPDGMAQEITLILNQDADVLTGNATFTWDREDDDDSCLNHFEAVRTFSVTGRVRDRFVQLSLTHVDRKRIGVNSYLLEVCGDGRKMEGIFSFYSLKGNTLDSSRHTLYRDRVVAASIAKERKEKRRIRQLELLEKLRGEIEHEEEFIDPDLESRQHWFDLDEDVQEGASQSEAQAGRAAKKAPEKDA